jgi:glycosyltransferase involved in cell wall biosynthesis
MKSILSIIIPAYNEENRIKETLINVSEFLKLKNINFEIIVVANNCKDNTVLILEDLKKKIIPEIRIIDIPSFGIIGNTKGFAIKEGMKNAIGDYHLFIDADNATYFGHVLDFIHSINEGYDVVIGSRYIDGSNFVKKQSLIRILLSRIGNLLIRILLIPNIKDTQCGYKMFSKDSSRKIFSKTVIHGWGSDMEVLTIARKYDLKIKEFPVRWENKDRSTLRPNAFFYTLKDLFIIRKNLKKGLYN